MHHHPNRSRPGKGRGRKSPFNTARSKRTNQSSLGAHEVQDYNSRSKKTAFPTNGRKNTDENSCYVLHKTNYSKDQGLILHGIAWHPAYPNERTYDVESLETFHKQALCGVLVGLMKVGYQAFDIQGAVVETR